MTWALDEWYSGLVSDNIRVSSTKQLFWCTDVMTPTPCTQRCLRTWAALRRRVASRTNSLDMRSLAPSVMWAQSLSGNSYLPCWMLSNRWLWGENITQYPVKLKQSGNILRAKIWSGITVSVCKCFLTWSTHQSLIMREIYWWLHAAPPVSPEPRDYTRLRW